MADQKGSEIKPAAEHAKPTPAPLEWEYLTRILPEQDDLNKFGADRWELIGVKDHGFNESIYYFKRPKI